MTAPAAVGRTAGRAIHDVSNANDSPRRARSLVQHIERIERWLRTNPVKVGVLVALLMLVTMLVQEEIDEHLWLVFTYAFPVALAGYGLGFRGGAVAALVATALLYDHAIHTLGTKDTVFVLTTRLAGSLAVAGLCALASATARARERYIARHARLAKIQEEFLAAFAHDIRSPLNAILGYASILQEEAEEGSGLSRGELFEALQRIEANALHVEEMIAGMLRADGGDGAVRNEVTTFTADALIDELRRELDPVVLEHGAPVTWTVAPGTPELVTDRKKLHSVLRNLVGNALKYARGAPIAVSVRWDAPTARHQIEVRDEGPGISPEALPRLFDRFYRAAGRDAEDGFGLGLFIVKRMIEMIGGDVSVHSELGEGSRFLLTFPQLRGEEAVAEEAKAS